MLALNMSGAGGDRLNQTCLEDRSHSVSWRIQRRHLEIALSSSLATTGMFVNSPSSRC